MSSENTFRRRCTIKKLDFENCVVTTIKTKSRGRRKLRARVTHEVENVDNVPDETKDNERSSPNSPVLKCSTQPREKGTSPVLIKKQLRGTVSTSPVFHKRRKITFEVSQEEFSGDSITEEVSFRQRSPVFKVKNLKYLNISPSQNRKEDTKDDGLERTGSIDLFSTQENSNSDKFKHSYQIEESTQGSKQTVDISSVESDNIKVKRSDPCYIEVNCSSRSTPETSYMSDDAVTKWPLPHEKFSNMAEPTRRNYKKNSLLASLERVQRKQASDKLLWQHRKRKKSVVNGNKFSIISFWNEETNYFLKCRSLASESEICFLLVDTRWVPSIKNIRENSIIEIQPPWQKLVVEESGIIVLLNVMCLEILNEVADRKVEDTMYESTQLTDRHKTDQKLFIQSFFSSYVSGYLY